MMEQTQVASSEKTILYTHLTNGLQLSAEVTQLQPTKRDNTVPQSQIGRFRSLDDRICTISQLDFIRRWYESFNQAPPSFLEAGPRAKLYFEPEKITVAIV